MASFPVTLNSKETGIYGSRRSTSTRRDTYLQNLVAAGSVLKKSTSIDTFGSLCQVSVEEDLLAGPVQRLRPLKLLYDPVIVLYCQVGSGQTAEITHSQ